MVSTMYTDYVASLKDDGSPPDTQSLQAVWTRLQKDLRIQMSKRGLLRAPPSYLGISGTSWEDPDVMGELVQETYIFIFVEGLEKLRNYVLLGRSIDPLVILKIKHLLSQLQREADPIGYKVFQLLKSAVLAAIDAEALHVLRSGPNHHIDAGDPGEEPEDDAEEPQQPKNKLRIHNDTVLGFHPDTSPDRADLGDHVRAWNDELLPDLMTARSRAVTRMVERLTALIVGLRAAGVEAFRFRDLIDPMRHDVRERWRAVWEDSLGELAPEAFVDGQPTVMVPLIAPSELEDPRELRQLLGCVTASIHRLPEKKPRERKTKDYLWKLWTFVRGTALVEDSSADGTKVASHVELNKRLGIPRHRLPGLLDLLGRLVQACRSGDAGGSADERLTSSTENQDTPRYTRRDEPKEAS